MTPSPASRAPAVPIELLFVVLADSLLLDLAGPAEAFRLANQHLEARGHPPPFRLRFVGPEAVAPSSVGLQLHGLEPLPEPLPPASWIVLLGRSGLRAGVPAHERHGWMGTRHWLARTVAPALAAGGHRLLTVCAGALLAADAGLLAGRQVTTHHDLLDELARLAPTARVCPNRVFVEDAPCWSSAGITAGIDLALHAIGQVCGEATAAAVAQTLVVFQRRGRDDPQRSPLLAGRDHLHAAVHRVQNAVCEHPQRPWSLAALAEVAHVTPRHLSRLFREHTGLSPRDYVEQVRRGLAEQAVARGLGASAAAELAGFASDRQWRRARARGRPGTAGG